MKKKTCLIISLLGVIVIVVFASIIIFGQTTAETISPTTEYATPALVSPTIPTIVVGDTSKDGMFPEEHHPIAGHSDGGTTEPVIETEKHGPSSLPADHNDTSAPNESNAYATNPGGNPAPTTSSGGQLIPPEQPDDSAIPSILPEGNCIVTFVDFDGTEIVRKSVEIGAAVSPPQPPIHEGMLFVRWDKSLENIRGDRTIQGVYQKVTSPTIAIENVYVDSSKKTAVVTVSVLDNPGISSLFISISYDNHLSLRKVEYNGAFGEYVTAPEPFSSPQNICVLSPFSDIEASGIFATLSFDINGFEGLGADRKVKISLSCDQDNTFNTKYDDVWFDLVDGSITFFEGGN